LTEYNEIFIGKAYEKLSNVCKLQFIGVDDRETVRMKTMDEVIEFYHHIREPLDGRGYKTSRRMLSDGRISVFPLAAFL
jgi:hypothetical protein